MTEVALALLRRGDRWFLQRRDPANAVLPGLWEFPGGKVEAGETPQAALARELREEVGLGLCEARPWPVLDGPIRLHPFLVETQGEPRTSLAWGWFTAPEMLRLSMPPRNTDLVARLAAADLIG
ncbi:MAG: NUDIX domain-containing protein [Geothrix sp.]|uniref:(deoxy)nucleoside triphosphate pyrophosphohydrolase n=1 Tax=Geothrix sp. TaxID=1962974 RepID=UPI00178FBFFF|nr:NUDIX domain-containing protein [Geothrix sp.]NWJ42425.1 NUDIX domain-containing protein [Geothrix sp.]